MNTPPTRRRLPTGPRRPARCATPTSVPVLSNRSTNRKTKTTVAIPISSAPRRSSARKVGARLGGVSTIPANGEIASRIPAIAVPRMAMMIAPGTARRSRATITMNRDEAGLLHRDDPEKQADAGGDRHFLRQRYGIDDPGADAGQAEDQEQESRQEHRTERH